MSDTKTLSEVLAEMKQARNSPKMVRDWRALLPAGSKWHPGDPGNPACKECDGTGYLRLDGLSVGHPYFGKIILCDCTRGRATPTAPRNYQQRDLREMPEYLK